DKFNWLLEVLQIGLQLIFQIRIQHDDSRIRLKENRNSAGKKAPNPCRGRFGAFWVRLAV
ncbi:MAG: hypothetical protein ACK5M8_15200, partial [Shewanella algae]